LPVFVFKIDTALPVFAVFGATIVVIATVLPPAATEALPFFPVVFVAPLSVFPPAPPLPDNVAEAFSFLAGAALTTAEADCFAFIVRSEEI
jgi:hypothetical protein